MTSSMLATSAATAFHYNIIHKRFYASLKIKEMLFGCTVTINKTFISLELLLDTVKGLEFYILIMLIGIQQHSNTYI